MDRETMLKRLKAGYNPIDVSIEKWKDIKETNIWVGIGSSNCALCEVYYNKLTVGCGECPLKHCSIYDNEKDTPWRIAITEKNAQVMIDALEKIKNKAESIDLLKEKTYSIGQKFKYKDGDKYILARCDTEICINGIHCTLIDLQTGNLWTYAQEVKNLLQITQTEFKKIVGEYCEIEDFEEIEKDE